jgi:predicted nuclease of restriction endonuclease-like (RecB) superfamily
MTNKNLVSNKKYDILISQIGNILQSGHEKAIQTVNAVLVQTYWEIGKYIVEFEQKGSEKSEYGSNLLEQLSKDLKQRFGKGFSRSNLFKIRKLFIKFQKIQTLSGFLSWSHYCEILSADDDLEIQFYTKQCELEHWSVRELKRQMNSSLFYRLAKSKNKADILALAKKGIEIQNPKDIIKDPYVFEFLGIPENQHYTENELEEQLINNLSTFLMELGKGFTFVARQFRITLNNTHYYVDLVFYHRILKCFVLIDLKQGKIEHNDIGQMNLYLNYFRKEENVQDDNEPIGIVLGARKDEVMVEYATEHITNKLFVSKYQLYLPNKELLASELKHLLDDEQNNKKT